MDYRIIQDIEAVRELSGMTLDELASALEVSRVGLANWLSGRRSVSSRNIRNFYEYAFSRGYRLNRIKEQLYTEDLAGSGRVLLFHGAKNDISGELSLSYSKVQNDFGRGFYCGERLEQSAMFVAAYPESSLYMLSFSPDDLNGMKLDVNRDWMIIIAHFRGRLGEYDSSAYVQDLVRRTENIDYYVAPIADNRMFEIIDQFIDGEITDEQCRHCLSATDLGNQYVFVSPRALSQVTLLEHCYLAPSEKAAYLESRRDNYEVNRDKVRLARKQYRNQGQYIEDILR